MATPTFQAAGALVSGIAAVTAVWPPHAVGDIAFLQAESAGGEAVTLTTPSGFVAVASSPQFTGAGTAGTRLTMFWCRATSTAMPSVVVGDPGDHVIARIITFRNCVSQGNPWNAVAGAVKAVASTSISAPGVTTTVPDCLICYFMTRDNDATTAAWSAQANAGLTSVTERVDQGRTQGNGGGIGLTTGIKAVAGVTGNLTATVTNTVNAFITLALMGEITGTISYTEENDTVIITGTPSITGTISYTEENDVVEISNTPPGVVKPSLTGIPESISSIAVNGTTTLNVPADCNAILFFFDTWFQNEGNGIVSATLGGNQLTIIENLPQSGNAATVGLMAIVNPPTGSQTFTWGWSTTPWDGPGMAVVYLKNANTSSLVRDSAVVAYPVEGPTTDTLSLSTGSVNDFVIGYVSSYISQGIGSPAGSGQTVVLTTSLFNNVCAQVAVENDTLTPTTVFSGTGNYLKMVAVALKASGGVGEITGTISYTEEEDDFYSIECVAMYETMEVDSPNGFLGTNDYLLGPVRFSEQLYYIKITDAEKTSTSAVGDVRSTRNVGDISGKNLRNRTGVKYCAEYLGKNGRRFLENITQQEFENTKGVGGKLRPRPNGGVT